MISQVLFYKHRLSGNWSAINLATPAASLLAAVASVSTPTHCGHSGARFVNAERKARGAFVQRCQVREPCKV